MSSTSLRKFGVSLVHEGEDFRTLTKDEMSVILVSGELSDSRDTRVGDT